MRIDSHQHFWKFSRGDYGWLNSREHPSIFRDFLPADLVPLLKDARIDATVLVQAAPSLAETEFLLDLAAKTPFVAGVVGWVDFEQDQAPEQIETLAKRGKLVGLRPMIQDIEDERWLLRPQLMSATQCMTSVGLAFDALVKPRHLPVLAEFLARYPDLRVVIDHGAKPDIAAVDLEVWSSDMGGIARTSRACCKLSGLVTEAGSGWTAAKLKPFVEVLLESFGPARLMWGSDWPVVNEAADYAGWLEAAERLTQSLPESDRQLIFGGTAKAFYRL